MDTCHNRTLLGHTLGIDGDGLPRLDFITPFELSGEGNVRREARCAAEG